METRKQDDGPHAERVKTYYVKLGKETENFDVLGMSVHLHSKKYNYWVGSRTVNYP